MSVLGVAFRNTSGFTTDVGGDTYDLGAAYPVTRGGLTFGWASADTANSRDRTGTTAKMAGIHFVPNGGTLDWTLDLPNGAGTYDVRIALGDEAGAQNCHAVIKDTSTTKVTLNGTTVDNGGGGANTFIDAANSQYAETAWVASNVAASIVFATTKMVITLGGFSGGTGNSAIAYVSVLQTAGGGGATFGRPFYNRLIGGASQNL